MFSDDFYTLNAHFSTFPSKFDERSSFCHLHVIFHSILIFTRHNTFKLIYLHGKINFSFSIISQSHAFLNETSCNPVDISICVACPIPKTLTQLLFFTISRYR